MKKETRGGFAASSIPEPSKQLGWMIHMVGWIIVFILPFFFSGGRSQEISLTNYFRICTNLFAMGVVFYFNYSFSVERFLLKKKTKQYLLSNFLLITGVIITIQYIMALFPLPFEMGHQKRELSLQDKVMFNLMLYTLYMFVAGLGVAFKMTNSWQKAESERKELERSRSEAELQNLKSQLNPHFLFNTLNNIYSLIAFSPDRAQEAVHELSRLLRYVLYESNETTVPLSKDLTFVSNYVELMHIRMPENVELKTTIEPIKQDLQIAPLLFITPIENAFKHGVSNNKPSFIHIDIKSDGKQINCTIRNSYFPKDEQDKSGSGIGLENLRKRLALLYPDKYQFDCRQEGDAFYSFLSITI